jgi:hypothetical protein
MHVPGWSKLETRIGDLSPTDIGNADDVQKAGEQDQIVHQ